MREHEGFFKLAQRLSVFSADQVRWANAYNPATATRRVATRRDSTNGAASMANAKTKCDIRNAVVRSGFWSLNCSRNSMALATVLGGRGVYGSRSCSGELIT